MTADTMIFLTMVFIAVSTPIRFCSSRDAMRAVLKDIQDGTFAKNWVAENEAGMPKFRELMKADLEHPIEKVGADLRGRMDWLEE